MAELFEPGLIFLSHASVDKHYIEEIKQKIPKSHVFYDVDSIDPGTSTIDALDDGLNIASVFAMFVSPSTQKTHGLNTRQRQLQFRR